jgi:DNA topoisomerase-1
MLYPTHERLIKKLEKIGRDPKITAKAVGLRYVSDSTPVIPAKKLVKGWSYLDADGKTWLRIRN